MARKFKTGGLRKIRNVSSLRHVCIHGPSSFLLLFYSALLFYLSTRPHHSLSFLPFILGSPFDKMFHFIEYGILGFLWVSWLRNFQWKLQGKKIWIVILICLVYSLIDEWVQSVIPNRVSSGADVIADLLGSSAGIFLARVLWWKRFAHHR